MRHSKSLSRGSWRLIAVIAALAAPAICLGTRIDGGNNDAGNPAPVGAEPPQHHSFVRDGNHGLMATDAQYAQLIGNAMPGQYDSVDVEMDQCFGGGFLNDIAGIGKPYTFASASGYYEPAFFTYGSGVTPPNAVIPNVPYEYGDDFTRAWTDFQLSNPGSETMLQAFNGANSSANAAPPLRDPFSRPTQAISGAEERPQYSSDNGTSDARTLKVDPEEQPDVWAILIDTDYVADPNVQGSTFALDIQRMYLSLTSAGVPASHIAVLYPGLAGKMIPATTAATDPTSANNGFLQALPAVPVNATNNTTAFENALDGKYFTDPNGGPTTSVDSQLFVYNGGHGGHTSLIPAGQVGMLNPNAPAATLVRYSVPVNGSAGGGGGFGVPGPPTIQNTGTESMYRPPATDNIGGIPGNLPASDPLPGDADNPNLDRIELITTAPIINKNAGDVTVSINGNATMPLPAIDMTPTFDSDEILDGTFTYYTMDFPLANFVPNPLLDPNNILIDLYGLQAAQQTPNILYAIDLIGGSQEYLAVVLPEPTTAAMGLMAVVGLLGAAAAGA